MSTSIEVEKLALDLPERQRATLAASLLDSLPGILSDEDEGIAEACDAMQSCKLILLRLSLSASWIRISRADVADADRVSSADRV